MDIKDGLTLALAALGAVLGVLNTWRAWSADRVRLRVKTAFAVDTMGQWLLTVDVVNLSAFPVTVTHVGFDLLGSDRHCQCVRPLLLPSRGALPERLESRAALTVLQPLAAFQQDTLERLNVAYVRTACGLRIQSRHCIAVEMHKAAVAAQHAQGVE